MEGLVYARADMLDEIGGDGLRQVANVAHLPGIVGRSIGMPDIHRGYGFPIGGVAAFDPDEGGVVSPGGVGYDINCGVRLLRSDLDQRDIRQQIAALINRIMRDIPAGVCSHHTSFRLTDADLEYAGVRPARGSLADSICARMHGLSAEFGSALEIREGRLLLNPSGTTAAPRPDSPASGSGDESRRR